jgi:glycosyltransferase involved in cell wall biosynthesis
MTVTALILAKNEELHLPRLLKSLGWVDETVVVDNLSTDRTAAVAKEYGAKVISCDLGDFSSLWNAGLAVATGDWVFSFDADEEVPAECVPQFQEALRSAPSDLGGYRVLRRNFALGRWLRHGQQFGKLVHWYDLTRRRRGHRPGDHLGGAVKLYRRAGARYQNLVHEEVRVQGRIAQLQAYVNHYTADSIQDMFDKVNSYTTLHARQLFLEHPQGLPNGIWRHLWWTPWRTFFSYYIRKRGFLDGFPGLARAWASAYYERLKYLKLFDQYRRKPG